LLNRKGSEEAKLKKADQAFEGYFIYTLLKEMQKTTGKKEGLFGKGPGGDVYQHFFHQALADKLSTERNGIGLTKFLMDAFHKRGSHVKHLNLEGGMTDK